MNPQHHLLAEGRRLYARKYSVTFFQQLLPWSASGVEADSMRGWGETGSERVQLQIRSSRMKDFRVSYMHVMKESLTLMQWLTEHTRFQNLNWNTGMYVTCVGDDNHCRTLQHLHRLYIHRSKITVQQIMTAGLSNSLNHPHLCPVTRGSCSVSAFHKTRVTTADFFPHWLLQTP